MGLALRCGVYISPLPHPTQPPYYKKKELRRIAEQRKRATNSGGGVAISRDWGILGYAMCIVKYTDRARKDGCEAHRTLFYVWRAVESVPSARKDGVWFLEIPLFYATYSPSFSFQLWRFPTDEVARLVRQSPYIRQSYILGAL